MNHSTPRKSLAVSAALLFLAACKSSDEAAAESKAGEPAAEPTKSAAAQAEPAAPPTAPPPQDTVHCLGIHECKGQSACHVAGGHACAGQNDCKGKGWIVVPKPECEAKGGTILDS